MWTLSPQETYIVCGVVSYSIFVYAWYISHFFIEWAPARSKPLKHFSWGRGRNSRFNNNNNSNNNNNNPGSWGSSSCDRQNPNQHDEAITVVPLKDIPTNNNNNNNNDDNNNIDKSIMNSSSTNYQSITQQPVLPSHTLQDIPAHHQSIGGHGVVEFNLQQDPSRQHHQHY